MRWVNCARDRGNYDKESVCFSRVWKSGDGLPKRRRGRFMRWVNWNEIVNDDKAERLFQQSLKIKKLVRDPIGIAWTLHALGELEREW